MESQALCTIFLDPFSLIGFIYLNFIGLNWPQNQANSVIRPCYRTCIWIRL